MLFRKNRAIKLSFIDEPKEPKHEFRSSPFSQLTPNGTGGTADHILIENVTRHGKDFLTHAAATVVVAYSAVRVIDTVCKIAVVAAKAKVQ
jgi:hypothetical protein